MRAIVLVGGKGTRLRGVVADVPKPMAPIHGKPFLAYLLHYLKEQGITEVVFSTHYMADTIRAYFQSQYAGITIHYAEEDTPLGTGGAIVNALKVISDKQLPLFVINGDTFLKLNYQAMAETHQQQGALLTLALHPVEDVSRFGQVVVENNRIINFQEKGKTGAGLINAGVYLLSPAVFASYDLPRCFSFETDFLLTNLPALKPSAFISNDYFIDIGIPDDYAKAIQDLSI